MSLAVHADEASERPAAWTFWARFLLFPTLAVAAYPGLVLNWGGDHWLVRSAWVVFLTYCWFCVGGAFHEAVHQTLFRSATANLWYGRLMGVVVFIPYTVYRETHRRHHACLNTPDDYEMWPYSDPKCSLTFRRVFVWVDLVASVVTTAYQYGRIYFVGDPKVSAEARRTIAWEYAASCVFFTLLIWWAIEASDDGQNFDFVWLLPLLLSPPMNTLRKFVEHLGMTSTEPLLGTRTILHGNLLTRVLSFFNFDISIHGPHHRYPRAGYFELPDKLAVFQESHPEARVPVFPSYLAAFAEVAPILWRNPATGTHAELSGVGSLEADTWDPPSAKAA